MSRRGTIIADRVSTIAALALACLLAIPAAAQTTRSSTVSGAAADPTGAVLPNATVELRPAGTSIASMTTTTDRAGAFRFDNVPPGVYDVVVSFEGFQTTTARVVVGARAPAPVRMTLPLAGLTQQVTVSDSTLQVDTTASKNLNAVTVDESTLSNLPVFDQDYVATMSRFLDSAAIGTGGVTLIVNGLEANGLGVSASAIKQIKINQDPYSAEYNRPGRGRIEVITKPGSQAYHGTANAIFRDSHLNAREPFAVVKPDEQRRIVEGYVGGPIAGGEHSSFVVSGTHDEEDQQLIVHAVGLAGPIAANVPNPYRHSFVSGSVSHQQGDRNTISLRTSFRYRRSTNQGAGGLTLPEAATNNLFHELESVYTHDTILSPTLLHQARLLYGQYFNGTTSVSSAPGIVVLDAFTGGGAQADFLRTEHHAEIKDTLTWTVGRHVVKGGVDIPDWSRRRFDDNSNRGGTFDFASLQQYARGTPYSFAIQQGNGHEVFLEKVLGLFVQDDMHLGPGMTASVGLRYDRQNYFTDNDNFAPRASVAWAPERIAHTVIRAGAGLFYDRTGPGPISDLLHSQHGQLLKYVISDPSYPDPLAAGASLLAQPRSIVELAPVIDIPRALQYSAGVERQLEKTLTLAVTYIGIHGGHLFLSRDVNAPLPPGYAARPDPGFGVERQIETTGRMQSHALQVTLRGDMTAFFTGQTQYTVGRTMNDTGGINWFPSNDYTMAGEWGRAGYDQRQRFDSIGTFRIGQLFDVGAALALYSGQPYSLLAGADRYHNDRSNARPAGVARNTLTGPGYADLDVRWFKDLKVRRPVNGGDPGTVRIGVDAFNILNRTNYASYIGTLGSPLFGQAVSAKPPRRIQLSLRTQF